MKKGLYPIIAGTLVLLLVLTMAFEGEINALSALASNGLIILVALVVLGAVLLAAWDTGIIGKKKD